MSGVVFISAMTSPSSPPSVGMDMAMDETLSIARDLSFAAANCGVRFRRSRFRSRLDTLRGPSEPLPTGVGFARVLLRGSGSPSFA
jgi:hypothetical protein